MDGHENEDKNEWYWVKWGEKSVWEVALKDEFGYWEMIGVDIHSRIPATIGPRIYPPKVEK